jgi:hypothetical protein
VSAANTIDRETALAWQRFAATPEGVRVIADLRRYARAGEPATMVALQAHHGNLSEMTHFVSGMHSVVNYIGQMLAYVPPDAH